MLPTFLFREFNDGVEGTGVMLGGGFGGGLVPVDNLISLDPPVVVPVLLQALRHRID